MWCLGSTDRGRGEVRKQEEEGKAIEMKDNIARLSGVSGGAQPQMPHSSLNQRRVPGPPGPSFVSEDSGKHELSSLCQPG